MSSSGGSRSLVLDTVSPTSEGQLGWDSVNKKVQVNNGTNVIPVTLCSVCSQWNAVNLALSGVFFTADRAYKVLAITTRIDVAGSSVGGVTVVIRKVASGVAVASGTALHTGSINLKGAANTNQALTLSSTASDLQLAAGDSLALDLTGISTLGQGSVTVTLLPL